MKAILSRAVGLPDALRKANEARDARDYKRAAALYEQVLTKSPKNAGIHIQCGHMNKELGRYKVAEEHYLAAKEIKPDDPDLHLQLGHLYKIVGRISDAIEAYGQAEELAPEWTEPTLELEAIRKLAGDFAVERLSQSRRQRFGKADSVTAFLKNIPAAQFSVTLRSISASRQFHLLAGADSKVGDQELSEGDLLHLMRVCIEAGDLRLLARVCKASADHGRLSSLPMTMVLDVLGLAWSEDDSPLAGEPPAASLNGSISSALGIIYRQRALIEELLSIAEAR